MSTSAERLIAELQAMPQKELTRLLCEARESTPAELVERQRAERRERAEKAAARLQS